MQVAIDGGTETVHGHTRGHACTARLSQRSTRQSFYVDKGDVLTSAGKAAGTDLCLHVVRRDHSAAVANRSPGDW